MSVKDYALEADLNTSISGINIAEGCPPSGINDAIRQLMADVKAESEAQAQAVAVLESAVSAAESDAEQKIASLDTSLRAVIAEGDASSLAAATAAQSAADAAQSTADSKADKLVSGNGVVRTVNGVAADAEGGVTISIPATPTAYITEKWSSGANWYRKWSDGWIEQGGQTASIGSTSSGTTTFPTPFTSTNYTIVCQDVLNNGSGKAEANLALPTKNKNSFVLKNYNYGAAYFSWYACGF